MREKKVGILARAQLMDRTRLTLIERISGGQEDAWVEVDGIYRPLIHGWLSRYRLQSNDAEDITQEVLSVLVRQIGSFHHNGRTGAFRNWLRSTTVNVARSHLRNITRPSEKVIPNSKRRWRNSQIQRAMHRMILTSSTTVT